MVELGAGRMLPWRRLDARRLTSELAQVVREPAYRARATALRAHLEAEDGTATAVARLESLLAR